MARILEQQIEATEHALFEGQPPRVKLAGTMHHVRNMEKRVKYLEDGVSTMVKKLSLAQSDLAVASGEFCRAQVMAASFEAEVAAE